MVLYYFNWMMRKEEKSKMNELVGENLVMGGEYKNLLI
jgi:hypothetical protein